MGCDIHICVEVKQSVDGVVTWINCDDWRVNKYHGLEEGEKAYDIKPL